MLTTEFDMMTALRVREAEGREEGREVGREEGIYAVAKNLIRISRPIDEIALVTGLARYEVERMRDDDA